MDRIKEFLKVLEEDEKLCSVVAVICCFISIGILTLLCWLFG